METIHGYNQTAPQYHSLYTCRPVCTSQISDNLFLYGPMRSMYDFPGHREYQSNPE